MLLYFRNKPNSTTCVGKVATHLHHGGEQRCNITIRALPPTLFSPALFMSRSPSHTSRSFPIRKLASFRSTLRGRYIHHNSFVFCMLQLPLRYTVLRPPQPPPFSPVLQPPTAVHAPALESGQPPGPWSQTPISDLQSTYTLESCFSSLYQ